MGMRNAILVFRKCKIFNLFGECCWAALSEMGGFGFRLIAGFEYLASLLLIEGNNRERRN